MAQNGTDLYFQLLLNRKNKFQSFVSEDPLFRSVLASSSVFKNKKGIPSIPVTHIHKYVKISARITLKGRIART